MHPGPWDLSGPCGGAANGRLSDSVVLRPYVAKSLRVNMPPIIDFSLRSYRVLCGKEILRLDSVAWKHLKAGGY